MDPPSNYWCPSKKRRGRTRRPREETREDGGRDGGMQFQAKGCQGLQAATRRSEEARKDSSWEPSRDPFSLILFVCLFIFFLGPLPQHMEIPRLGVELELQLPAYTRATAMWDLCHVCDLHRSSRQRWILNPLSEARDRTHILMDPRWVRYCWAMTGTPIPPI